MTPGDSYTRLEVSLRVLLFCQLYMPPYSLGLSAGIWDINMTQIKTLKHELSRIWQEQ
jgi:hypothetical protein